MTSDTYIRRKEMDKTVMDAPCKGCERSGCGPYHDQCEKFQTYKERVKAYKSYALGVSERRDYIKKAVTRMKGRK